MHKRLLLLCGWLLAGPLSFAQYYDTIVPVSQKNEWHIKLSPLAVFETDGGIGFSSEYVMPKQRLGFQLEMQPILFDVYTNEGEPGIESPVNVIRSGMPLGVKLRPEIRYYVEGLRPKRYRYFSRHPNRRELRRMEKMPERTYLAIDFLYKYTQRERLSDLPISNGGTGPVFQQRAVYKDVKQVTGFDFKFGFINSISDDNRFLLEGYIGFGIRYKHFSYRDLPLGASEPLRREIGFWGTTRNDDRTRTGVSFPAGLKFIYKL